MTDEILNNVIEAIKELEEDITVPKNVKNKLNEIRQNLLGEEETSIKVNKALAELDEINEDPNLQAYTRTQLWNIVSMLEKI